MEAIAWPGIEFTQKKLLHIKVCPSANPPTWPVSRKGIYNFTIYILCFQPRSHQSKNNSPKKRLLLTSSNSHLINNYENQRLSTMVNTNCHMPVITSEKKGTSFQILNLSVFRRKFSLDRGQHGTSTNLQTRNVEFIRIYINILEKKECILPLEKNLINKII